MYDSLRYCGPIGDTETVMKWIGMARVMKGPPKPSDPKFKRLQLPFLFSLAITALAAWRRQD